MTMSKMKDALMGLIEDGLTWEEAQEAFAEAEEENVEMFLDACADTVLASVDEHDYDNDFIASAFTLFIAEKGADWEVGELETLYDMITDTLEATYDEDEDEDMPIASPCGRVTCCDLSDEDAEAIQKFLEGLFSK